jgi:hypothetical protein
MIELKNADDSTLQAKIQKLEQRIQILEQRNVNVNALDELGTDDMGDMRAGRFLALLSGSNPTDPDANGSFMSAAGETFGSWLIKVGEVLNGQLQAGFGGGAMIWANGDGVADATGLNLNGIRYALRHYATDANGANARYGSYEMLFENGKTVPGLALTYMDGTINTELVPNGSFETGDFTGWQVNGSPSIASPGYFSNYCCSISGNTNNFITSLASINVSGGLNYIVSFNCNVASSTSIYVTWYDIGSYVVRNDKISSTNTGTWYLCSKVLIAPSTAVTAKIQVHCGVTGVSYIDNISMKSVGIFRQLLFGPEPEIYNVVNVRKILAAVKELPLPIAPTISLVATASGNCDNGAHTCKVTFVDAEGETLLGSVSNSVTVDASHKQITCPLPIGPWGTTGRNVYMCTVADQATWYLAATIADNTTTTINLSISDANLLLAAAAPGYNTTGSRPLFPRSAVKLAQEFLLFDSAGNSKAMTMVNNGSQVQFGFYVKASSSADKDRWQTQMYLEGGTYNFLWHGYKYTVGGIFDLWVDGIVVASTFDTYSSGNYDAEFTMSNITVTGSGYHLIELVLNGHNGSSSGYEVATTYIKAEQAKY